MARGLILWADGVRAVFQAGVVDGLATGQSGGWAPVWGVGTGAVNGLMVTGDQLPAMKRLWLAQADEGCSAFRPRLAAAAEALEALAPGLVPVQDLAALDGLCDPTGLREIIEPFAAAAAAGNSAGHAALVSVACLQTGEVLSLDPAADVEPEDAGALVLASCSRPPLLEPVQLRVTRPGLACTGRPCQFVSGAVGLPHAVEDLVEAADRSGLVLEEIDVVLATPESTGPAGFVFHGLSDLLLRGHDIAAEQGLPQSLERRSPGDGGQSVPVRLIRPTVESWQEFTGRPDADVLLEFPGAASRNRELLRRVADYGGWLAERSEHHTEFPSELVGDRC